MIKPSELAPRTGALLLQIIEEAFPPDYICVITAGKIRIVQSRRLLQTVEDYEFETL
jgi:acyl-CoA reductase-like NAD-dependent aldehyde dehydrogenase